jgi:integrase
VASIFTRRWKTASGQERYAHVVQYTVDGRRKKRQFTSKKRAHAFAESVDKVRKETIVDKRAAATPTVQEVADDWLDACKRGRAGELPLEPETIKTYKGYVKNHIGPFACDKNTTLGDLRIGALQRAHVRKFRDDLLASGLARITARKILIALKSIISHAIDAEHIDRDPSHKITIKLGGRTAAASPIEIHTPGDMRKIIKAARELAASNNKQTAKTWERYSLVIEVLVYCGLRPSELRGLPRTAFRDDENKLHIYQRADRSGIIGPPKTPQGVRTLYVPDDLSERLAAWLRTHNHELIFPCGGRHGGRPMYIENLRKRMWQHIQLVAEVPCYALYSTRHFFASRLIANGANVKEVSVLMGHSDEAFTLKVYGHMFKDAESEDRRRAMVETLL